MDDREHTQDSLGAAFSHHVSGKLYFFAAKLACRDDLRDRKRVLGDIFAVGLQLQRGLAGVVPVGISGHRAFFTTLL